MKTAAGKPAAAVLPVPVGGYDRFTGSVSNVRKVMLEV